MREQVIVVCNVETNEYFISPKHSSFDLEHFVPTTFYFPTRVGRYDQIELNTADEVVSFYHPEKEGYVNIANREDIQEILKSNN